MLKIQNLTKHYGDKLAVDHLSLHIHPGEIYGFIGHNGAGKSTTLKLLMNATSREDGQVSLLGTDNQSPDFLQTKQDIGWCWTRPACPRSSPPWSWVS